MRTVVRLLSLTLVTVGHADTPGYEAFEIDAPHHGRPMNAARCFHCFDRLCSEAGAAVQGGSHAVYSSKCSSLD